MIKAIVFSKGNPIRNQLLLDSIQKNAPGIFDVHIIEQNADFKKDLLVLLTTDLEFTTFLVEGDILFNRINETEINDAMADEDVFCFSMRLGENVKHCHTMSVGNVLHNHEAHGNIIKWNWTVHYLDFGFPLSLNGHIFRSKEILKLTKKVAFMNSDELEEGLQIFDNFPREKMASYKHNVLVNSLNLGLNGKESIDLEGLDFSNIIGCHQKIEFKNKAEQNEK